MSPGSEKKLRRTAQLQGVVFEWLWFCRSDAEGGVVTPIHTTSFQVTAGQERQGRTKK